MEQILKSQLREQAGSNSYNRFEYQVGWTVHHIIQKYKNDKPFFVFCEFHDDMSEITTIQSEKKMDFYQVKTKGRGNFTLKILTQKNAQKKHSFLGYLFYNQFSFEKDCNNCFFISNKSFDEDILKWKSIIEDGKILKKEDNELYTKIKNGLEQEFDFKKLSIDKQKQFNKTFDKFVQQTYFIKSDIPIDDHLKYIQIEFFDALKFKDIQLMAAHLIFDSIVEEVRSKTKTQIKTPISLKELKEKKGVNESVFNEIKKFQNQKSFDDRKNALISFFDYYELDFIKRNNLLKSFSKHQSLYLNPENSAYREEVNSFISLCEETLEERYDYLDTFSKITSLKDKLVDYFYPQTTQIFNKRNILEVLFYDCYLSE